MSKINISLPDGLLDEVDSRATASGTTRSAFMREAAIQYLSVLNEAEAMRERTERLTAARLKMRSVAHSVGAPDSTKVIRELRDAAPRWEKQ